MILANLDEADVFELLAAAKKARTGRIENPSHDRQLPSRETLQVELARIRHHGYTAVRDNEKCLIAAVLPNDHHPVTDALAIGGPSTRINSRRMKQLGELVTKRAVEASHKLGWASE